MDAPSLTVAASTPLYRATCEVAATRPAMLFGLPRKLAATLIFLCVMGYLFFDTWQQYLGTTVCGGIAWWAVREAVASDLWGFDNWLAWLLTDFARFLDTGGREGWGGPRLCALPLRPNRPIGVSHAAR